MVGRRDEHDVEIAFGQHFPEVAVGAWRLFRNLASGNHTGGVGKHMLVGVAQRDDLNRFNLYEPEEIGLAVPPAADQPNAARFGSSAN